MSFDTVTKFENEVAQFFGSPFAVAVDCCTHAIELCLRLTKANDISIPRRTYLSVPMTAEKLGLRWTWKNDRWEEYYLIGNTNIYDAAVLWRQNSYIPGTLMCLSFQFQKHLSLGRGGMVLTDDKNVAFDLKKMSYDGRIPNVHWRNQNVDTVGYHYYMIPEIAKMGLQKLPDAIEREPREWKIDDWPDLTKMEVFR
jgi:dTDP-4-amino-4,6-dideoxygalactose transaminase